MTETKSVSSKAGLEIALLMDHPGLNQGSSQPGLRLQWQQLIV